MGTSEQTVLHLVTRLSKEIVDHPDIPDADACIDLLGELKQVKITMSLLEKSKIGKYLTKSVKVFKRHKRTESTSGGADSDAVKNWERAIDLSNEVLEGWRKFADKEVEVKSKTAIKKSENAKLSGLPKSAAEYRVRLVTQKKDMYKDPPVLPPATVVIEAEKCALPKRSKTTGEISFVAGEDSSIQALLKDFHPNRTPEGKFSVNLINSNLKNPIVELVKGYCIEYRILYA